MAGNGTYRRLSCPGFYPEGWISLPADVRRKLGIKSGAVLEVQVDGSSVILRPAKGKNVAAEPEPAVAEEPASPLGLELPIAAPETPTPAKRRGRPPKSRE
jgi:AbrB family looped-hinge helix DNA binding protein